MSHTPERVMLARSAITGKPGGQAAPGSGATITIWESAVNMLSSLDCQPFQRVQLNIYSSHDSGASGVVFLSSFDQGANYRTQSATTYTNASDGARTWDYLMKGGNVKITYTNSANVLTAWEMEVVGCYDRNPGA